MWLPKSPSTLLEKAPQSIKRMHYLMGGFVEIEVETAETAIGISAIEAAFREMKRVESLLSRFSPESVTTKLNQFASLAPVKVSEEMIRLIEKCLYYSELTRGAFDLTVSPLLELWKRSEERERLPSPVKIEETLSRVGYRHFQINAEKRTVFFSKPEMKIDFGAVGKGYAVDQAVKILCEQGISKGIVSTGSNIYHLGPKPEFFGIRNPLDPDEVLTSVCLQNNAVSTSAAYERFWVIGGKEYGHLIDPLTGRPTKSNFLSASVVGPSAMASDILSSALFVGGMGVVSEEISDLKDFVIYLIDSTLSIRQVDCALSNLNRHEQPGNHNHF